MRKRLLLLAGICMLLAHTVLAQTVEVSGRVTDSKGDPISGVSVTEKGTRNGTTTNAGGNFKIQVKANATLVFTSIGYGRKEVAVSGNTVNVSMETASESISEVVVTSLGIKREKKALGYAVATVDKKALEQRPESDVVRLLNGKAPGVDVLNTSGISGSGTQILIRGVSTISGSSTPLFVVDGVPFDASTNSQANFNYGNITTSRFLDLDPNSIESISVLKGLSATTLYGELGRNGVVLITTKNSSTRRSNKKMEITATQSVFINEVANLPEYQHEYGGGFDLSLGLVFFSNWGAKITNPPALVNHPYDRGTFGVADAPSDFAFPQFVGAKYEYKAYNSVERFFRKGVIKTSSLNMSANGQQGSFNANFSYTDDEGFTPGNRLYKNNFGMGGNVKLSNNFTFTGTFNYSQTNFKSPPTGTSFGSGAGSPAVFGDLMYTPVSVDLIGLPWESPLDHSSQYYRPSNDIQHPIWTVNNAFAGQEINRIFGNMQLKYDFTDKLNIAYRVGYDNYSDFNSLKVNKGGVDGGSQYTLGFYRTVDGHNTIWDHTLITNWTPRLSNDVTLDFSAGINSQERIYSQTGQKSTQQLVYGLFDHDNFIIHENTTEDGSGIDFKSQTQTIGAFAQATFGYREYLYFTAAGRNSWSSNLEKDNRSLFYPSGSIAFIPTSAFDILKSSKMINYLKIRGGYATSANFGSPYSTRPLLNITTNVFNDRIGTVINANSISNRLANPNLKPELIGEIELGIEGKFVNNRISLDLTFYRRLSEDQILDRDLDPGTGFTVTRINAGTVQNKGIELGLGLTPVRTKDWRWQLDGNFTLNRSKVSHLPADIKQIVIDGFSNEGLFAINGKPLGVIQATATVRDPKTGQRVVDGNGDYLVTPDIQIIGDPTPLFKLTGISTLSYKDFSFRMQWDWTQGGDMLATTPATLVGRGLTKDVGFDRRLGVILPGVKQDGTPNDIMISTSRAYFNHISGFFGSNDLKLWEATVIRLREASLSYSFPQSIIKKLPFGSVSLTVSGQNLWYNAPNFPKYVHFDPETSSLAANSNVRGLEYITGPTSRRIGASLRITF
jgi:TonB-linked SusC/RagA family outer membrane protein